MSWVVGVEAEADELVAWDGVVVCLRGGGEAAGGAVALALRVAVGVDTDAERVLAEYAAAEPFAVFASVATLGGCAASFGGGYVRPG